VPTKNEWDYTFTPPPTFFHGEHRDNFTFTYISEKVYGSALLSSLCSTTHPFPALFIS